MTNQGRIKEQVKEIVGILMESEFYFDLSLSERHGLIRYLMEDSQLSAWPKGQAIEIPVNSLASGF